MRTAAQGGSAAKRGRAPAEPPRGAVEDVEGSPLVLCSSLHEVACVSWLPYDRFQVGGYSPRGEGSPRTHTTPRSLAGPSTSGAIRAGPSRDGWSIGVTRGGGSVEMVWHGGPKTKTWSAGCPAPYAVGSQAALLDLKGMPNFPSETCVCSSALRTG